MLPRLVFTFVLCLASVAHAQPSASLDRLGEASSAIASPPTTAPPEGFHFAIAHHGRYFVVLRTPRAEGEAPEGVGELRLVAPHGPTIVTRALEPSALPAIGVHAGAPFRLRGATGIACDATLGEPELLWRVFPYWEATERWLGADGAPPIPDAEIAAEAWGMADRPGGTLVVAEANPIDGDCEGALYAHPIAHAVRTTRAPIPTPRLVDAFRRSPSYRNMQADWRRAQADRAAEGLPRGPRLWDTRRDADRRVLTFWSRTGRRFGLVSAMADTGCGNFSGGIWALFEMTQRGLRFVDGGESYLAPAALVDIDGDGKPEVVFRDRIRWFEAGTPREEDITTTTHDCQC